MIQGVLAVEQAIADREFFQVEARCSERIVLGRKRNNNASESSAPHSDWKSPE
jgi:hypothetical protein